MVASCRSSPLDIQHVKGFRGLLRIKSTLATTTFVFDYLAQDFIPLSRMNDRMNRYHRKYAKISKLSTND